MNGSLIHFCAMRQGRRCAKRTQGNAQRLAKQDFLRILYHTLCTNFGTCLRFKYFLSSSFLGTPLSLFRESYAWLAFSRFGAAPAVHGRNNICIQTCLSKSPSCEYCFSLFILIRCPTSPNHLREQDLCFLLSKQCNKHWQSEQCQTHP